MMHYKTLTKFGIIIAAILFVCCSGDNGGDTCRKDIYLGKVQPLLQEWDDAVDVAGSAARIALGTHVDKLQSIRRKAQNLTIPPCAEPAHEILVQYMNKTIEAFLSFMSDEAEATVEAHFKAAGRKLDDWSEAIADLE